MKNTILSALVLVSLALGPGTSRVHAYIGSSPFAAAQSSVVVSMKADGTCSITNTTVQPRKQLEAQIRAMEQLQSMEDDEAPDEATPSKNQAKAEPAPMADEELFKKVREMYEQTGGRFNMSRENWKVYRVENAGSNQVQIVVSAAFPSLKDMMGLGAYTWGPSLVMMDDSTAQIDTNNQLRITFTREAGRSQSYLAAQTERYLKRIRMRQEWKLVLPGKIASSDFPLTDSNSTSLVFDPNSSELVDGVSKLMKLPALTVVADPAGVKFDGVLKSSELAEQMRSSMETEATIPITDAGPGFVAEPQAIEITTFHEFPDVRQLKESRRGTMILPPAENEGTAIQVKLFPPKGRILKSAGSVKVKLAKDDQGRPIPTLSKARRSSYSINSTGDGEKAVTVRLEMGLPEPDAKAIDEVQAEAVVLTIGGYKEMVFTNAQAEVKKEIDLGTIVSGAKLVIQKATSKGPAESLQIIVTGPKEVRQLEFTTGSEGSGTSQASVYDRNVTEKEGIVTRTVQVQNYNFGMNARTKENPIQLIARMPQDYKNERLQFTLTALDLL